MLRIAVCDDRESELRETAALLERYLAQRPALPGRVEALGSCEALLERVEDTGGFDLYVLDILMPGLSGIDAGRLRLQDSDVVLMFVTNMAQYAINGYAVGALDFVLKPVNYYTFSVRFARAITRAEHRENGQILLTLPDCVRRIDTRQIYYVEVQNRMLHYHTELGEFVLRGTMQSAEKELSRYHFVRCNHWYLVNLSHVAEVRREMVVVAGAELEISRRNRTAFLTALTDYVGGNG